MHLYFVTVSHKCKLEPELNFVLVTETEAVNTTLTHVSKQLFDHLQIQQLWSNYCSCDQCMTNSSTAFISVFCLHQLLTKISGALAAIITTALSVCLLC